VHLRIVDHDIQSQSLHRQSADGRQQRVRRDDAIVLRGHQSHARIHELLLRVENVERGSLPDPRLFANTVERNFSGVHLRRSRFDLRLGGVQLSPALHHRRPRLVAVDVKIEALLTKRFLVLANSGIFGAALINRDRELSQNGDVRVPELLRLRVVALRVGRREPKIGIKRAFTDFHRKLGNVDAVHRRQNCWALRLARDYCPLHRRGRQPINRRARIETAGIDPDHPAVIRLRGDVIRLCLKKLRTSCSQAGLRLSDVGACYFANVEAVTGLFQLLGEHFDVAAIEVEDRLVAYQIHVGGRGIKKDLLLGDAQGFARACDLAFRLTRAIGGLKSIEQGLRRGGAELPRTEIFADAGVDGLVPNAFIKLKNRLASGLKSREKSAKDLTGASSVEIQSAAAELPFPMEARRAKRAE
jgi:hypothetical protein